MADDLRDLVVDIYDTIADPARWSGVLDRVSDGLGARGCIIFEMQGLGEDRTISAPYYSSLYQAELLKEIGSSYGLTVRRLRGGVLSLDELFQQFARGWFRHDAEARNFSLF